MRAVTDQERVTMARLNTKINFLFPPIFYDINKKHVKISVKSLPSQSWVKSLRSEARQQKLAVKSLLLKWYFVSKIVLT
jgi:hypothetical protein